MKSKILMLLIGMAIMSIAILLLLLVESKIDDALVLKEWFLAFGFLVPAGFVYVWMVRRLKEYLGQAKFVSL